MNNLLKKGIDLIDASDFKISDIKPSDFAETRRIMSSDVSAWPGPYRYDRTPYIREIINRLSPDDPSRIVAVMKGAQIGLTAGLIENGIVWVISECPGPIIYMCGDKDLTKEVIEKRLEQAIDSCGIRHLIRPNAIRKTNKRTGDTSMSKEFAGGYLIGEGVNNPNKLRNRSLMYGFIDDFDAADIEDKKEGSYRSLIEMRFASYAFKMKLFYISTPTVKGRSNIENVYLLGDQRKYHIPCPRCGTMIDLKFREKTESGDWAGIHFEIDGHGKLKDKSIGYICQSCGGFFYEKEKYDLMNSGIWVPSSQQSEHGYYSYLISSLYAPPGMYGWEHYVRKFLECYPNGLTGKADVPLLKTFLNTVLAQTYEERGREAKIALLTKNTRGYKIGEVPAKQSVEDGNGHIVLLTCACDMNGTEDDGRLDYEVVAHSETGSTYSIDHGSIGTFQRRESKEERKTYTYRNNEPDNIWDIFFETVLKNKYPRDGGGFMVIMAIAVDVGFLPDRAYSFLEKIYREPVPVLKIAVKGEPDRVRKYSVDHANYKKSKETNYLYLLNVNQIKDVLAEKMELRWEEDSGYRQPPGFMNFPEPAEGKYTVKNYFTQFETERKVQQINSDGSEIGHTWQKKHSMVANHFWDCRVYNLAIRDIFSDLICKEAGIKDPTWLKFCEIIAPKKT